MYIRQNRVKNRLGALEGELGQVPTQSITIVDPVDGSQLTFSGPVNETSQIQAIVGMVSSAVSAAKKGQVEDAKKVLNSAKTLVPATGSQRDKVSFLINKAEKFIADRSAASGTSTGEVLTGVGAILAALAPAAQTAIQTQADAATARRALRAGQNAPSVPMYAPAQAANNTGTVIVVVGAIAVVGVLIMVMSKKK